MNVPALAPVIVPAGTPATDPSVAVDGAVRRTAGVEGAAVTFARSAARIGGATPKAAAPVEVHKFGRYDRPGARFEPSGVVRLGDTDNFLIVNDKADTEGFSVFARDPGSPGGAALRYVSGFDPKGTAGLLDKLEAAAGSRRQPGTYYAITSYEGTVGSARRRFVKLKVDDTGQLRGHELVPIANPRSFTEAMVGEPYAKVEALSLTGDEQDLIVGVRAYGPTRLGRRYTVMVLEYDMADLTREPKLLVDMDTLHIVGRSEGLSGLEYVPELGAWLMTTSYEEGDAASATAPGNGVGGHVWLVRDLARLKDPAYWVTLPRRAVEHKPEGVTYTHDGKILVIYDDDANRKSPQGGPGTFPLHQHESVLSLLHPAELQVPPAARS